MDNFAVGDRCLLHLLQSEAGQLLNGQHVTLTKASIQQERFQCKFDDGTIGNIKPENLQKIQSKPTTLRRHAHEEYEEDPCSICMEEVSITVPNTYRRYSCCGKLMHMKCSEQLYTSELSSQQKYSCPMCRTKNFENGSTEDIEQLRKWVERKKPWAMEYLASRYKLGCGVEQSDERAFELYKLAAEHHYGNMNAQFNLGIMYASGAGVVQDSKLALKWYTLAAEQGLVVAQFTLGNIYKNGRGQGVVQSDQLSFEFYTLAAEQGHAAAQFSLGNAYGSGIGVTQSYTAAREWYTKAALQGNKNAAWAIKEWDELEKAGGIPENQYRNAATSSTATNNSVVCSNCNTSETTNYKLKNCGCRAAKYCNNSKCQKEHWDAHKVEHRRLKALLKLNKEKEDEMKKEGATGSDNKKDTPPPTIN